MRKLGDERPQAREEAESPLFDLGPVAVPALEDEDALKNKDVKIVCRAECLLLQLNRAFP